MNTILYKDYKLRPLQESDKDIKLAHGLHKVIRQGYGADYRIVPILTIEKVKLWYKKELKRKTRVIEYSDEPIGHCGLKNNYFRIGFWHPKFMNHGHGTTIAKILLTYAFQYLGSKKVSLHVLDSNKIGVRCYQKTGFTFIRPLEEKVEVAGRFEQENLMEVKKENFSNNLKISINSSTNSV